MENENKSVYHFTKTQIAINYILKDQIIHMGQLVNTNDPWETENIIFSVISSEEEFPNSDSEFVGKAFKDVRNELKIFCVSLDDEKEEIDDKTNHQNLLGWQKGTLWAHYAEKHEGVCLEFDFKMLRDAIRKSVNPTIKVNEGKIDYFIPNEFFGYPLPDPPRGEEWRNGLKSDLLPYLLEKFFRKPPDWKYENEYRWIIQEEINGPKKINISKCIKQIYLGKDFDESIKSNIQEICNNIGVKVSNVSWHNGIAISRNYLKD